MPASCKVGWSSHSLRLANSGSTRPAGASRWALKLRPCNVTPGGPLRRWSTRASEWLQAQDAWMNRVDQYIWGCQTSKRGFAICAWWL